MYVSNVTLYPNHASNCTVYWQSKDVVKRTHHHSLVKFNRIIGVDISCSWQAQPNLTCPNNNKRYFYFVDSMCRKNVNFTNNKRNLWATNILRKFKTTSKFCSWVQCVFKIQDRNPVQNKKLQMHTQEMLNEDVNDITTAPVANRVIITGVRFFGPLVYVVACKNFFEPWRLSGSKCFRSAVEINT